MMSTVKSGGKKCSYINFKNLSSNTDVPFFNFPVRDEERCNLWIVNCGRDDLLELDVKKLQHRAVCAVHFKNDAFSNPARKRLLQNHPNSVPIPYFEVQLIKSPEPSSVGNAINLNLVSTPKNDQGNTENTHNTYITAVENNENTEACAQETLQQFNADFTLLAHTPISAANQTPLPIEDPTPRKRKLLKSLSRQRIVLNRARSKICFMSKRKKQHTVNELLDMLPHYISGETLVFVKMQIKHQKHRAWSEDEKNIALSLYYKSPSSYSFLRDRGFKLPCVTLIRKWINIYNVSPGFTDEVVSKLTKKAASMTDDEKQCVMALDEMSIKKALEYDPKHDLIEGFDDLGPLGRTANIASHALVFLLRGLKYQWKCPFAYVTASNGVKSESLALIIDMCLENIFKTGLDVRAVVCDQGSTNASAIRLLGVSEHNPYIMFGGKEINFLYDVPHVFKCIRNNLINHDIEVNGKLVSWSDIRSFYEIERNSPNDCRAAPKLSERHIRPQSFQKMSVKLATQVFSASVARGIQTACKTGTLNSCTALDTAAFLIRLNDIFDCLNSKYCYDNNPLKRPLSDSNTKAIKCLEDAIPFVESWKLTGVKRNPPCFGGLILCIRSVLSLYTVLKSEGNSYLLTGRLNQYPIENLFGVLRQRGGYNSNSSARQFRRNLQHAMSIRLMDPPGSANCEPDCDINLDVQEHVSGDSTNEILGENHQADDLTVCTLLTGTELYPPFEVVDDTPHITSQADYDALTDTTPLEDNVIMYIAGWLAKKAKDKFDCSDCSNTILRAEDSLEIPKEDILISLRAFTCHTGDFAKLNHPSVDFFNIVRSQVLFFSKWFKVHVAENKLHARLVKSIREETERVHEGWFNSQCTNHRLYILSTLVKCKLYYAVKWKSQDLRDRALINISKRRQNVKDKENKLNKKLKNVFHTFS